MLETEMITQKDKTFWIKELLESAPMKQVILYPWDFVTGEFELFIFTWQMKDGNFRTILKLDLNEIFQCNYFKMESLLDVFKIRKPNTWIALKL